MKPTILTRIDYALSQLFHLMFTGELWRGDINDFMRLPK